jgi:hypothetical protein
MRSGMGISRKLNTGTIPVWQRVEELAQGGFLLDITGYASFDASGNQLYIPAGTPMVFDEAARTAKALKVGVFAANATNTATDYQVSKGHQYKVGDYFSALPGAKAYAITAIDTSNANYDTISVGTTLGTAVTTGQFNFASSTTGASNSSYGGVNGVLYDDAKIEAGKPVSIVIRGTAYARRVPYSTGLDAALKTAGAFIIYSQSY